MFHPNNDESVQSEDLSELNADVIMNGKNMHQKSGNGIPQRSNPVPMMNPNTNIEHLDNKYSQLQGSNMVNPVSQ